MWANAHSSAITTVRPVWDELHQQTAQARQRAIAGHGHAALGCPGSAPETRSIQVLINGNTKSKYAGKRTYHSPISRHPQFPAG